MKLNYDISLEDLIAFNEYLAVSLRIGKRIFWIMVLGIPLFCLIVIIIFSLFSLFDLIIFSLIASLWILIYLAWHKWGERFYRQWFARKFFRDSKIIGSSSTWFDDKGVYSEGKNGSVNFDWSAIKKIVQTNRYIYIFVDTLMAVIIPKRVFKSPNELSSYWEDLNKSWKEAIRI